MLKSDFSVANRNQPIHRISSTTHSCRPISVSRKYFYFHEKGKHLNLWRSVAPVSLHPQPMVVDGRILARMEGGSALWQIIPSLFTVTEI